MKQSSAVWWAEKGGAQTRSEEDGGCSLSPVLQLASTEVTVHHAEHL